MTVDRLQTGTKVQWTCYEMLYKKMVQTIYKETTN